MGRALEASFVALMVIVVAFVIVPWVFARSMRMRRKHDDKVVHGDLTEQERRSREFDEWLDEDGPEGPHNRSTV